MSSEEIDSILDGIPMDMLKTSDKAEPATKAAVVEKTDDVRAKEKREPHAKKEQKKVVRAKEKREKKSCAFTLPEQCFALLLEDKWRDARKIALKWKREMETYKSQYEKWITK